MKKIVKSIAKILKGKKRVSRQHRMVTVVSGEYKIIIPPLSGKSSEFYQIATVYKDDEATGILQVNGKVISSFNTPMDINKIWGVSKGLAKALREKGYKFPYIRVSHR